MAKKLLPDGRLPFQKFILDRYDPASLFTTCKKWLKDELGFQELSASKPLDSSIASYCRLLQRAQKHRLDGNTDEAFLTFVIAIDLLLGLEGRSTESISMRASILVHRQMERTIDEQINRIKNLYSTRSKYVHEGKSTTENDLDEIEKVCTEILWNLLTTSALSNINEIENWLKRIDFIASAMKASIELPETEFQNVGIPPIGYKRYPPNKIGNNSPLCKSFITGL